MPENNFYLYGLCCPFTSNIGFKHSEETKRLMSLNRSGINNPMYGKKIPQEVLKKRSKMVIENKIYKGENNPNFRFKIKKDDLLKFYLDENKTINQISNIYGCCDGVIKNNLKNYKIKKPKSNKYNLDIKNILELKMSGKNLIEIGKKYGCSNKIISKYIKSHKNV